jgi:hypothetical protein
MPKTIVSTHCFEYLLVSKFINHTKINTKIVKECTFAARFWEVHDLILRPGRSDSETNIVHALVLHDEWVRRVIYYAHVVGQVHPVQRLQRLGINAVHYG